MTDRAAHITDACPSADRNRRSVAVPEETSTGRHCRSGTDIYPWHCGVRVVVTAGTLTPAGAAEPRHRAAVTDTPNH